MSELDDWTLRKLWSHQSKKARATEEVRRRQRRRPRGTKLVGKDDIPVRFSEMRPPPPKTQPRPEPTDVSGHTVTRVLGKGRLVTCIRVRR